MSRRAIRRQWMPSPRRALLAVSCLVLGLALTAVGGAGTGVSAQTASAPQPVDLKGEGSWGPYQELVTWQNDLYGAKAPVNFDFTSTGSPIARQDFASGGLDYVISGRPFLPAELAHIKGGAAALIDVPVQVTAAAFLLAVPEPEGWDVITLICDPYDPNTPDPDKCIVHTPYSGPIRVPNQNLAAMVFRYAGPGEVPISSWNAPEVLSAMGIANLSLPPQASPAPVMRSEPSAMNFYLQQFAQTAAPTVWAGLKAQDSRVQWEPITERLPRLSGASRQGVDQQSLQLGLAGADPASGGISGFTKGILAPVPPSALEAVHQVFPHTLTTLVQMQNASGDWVGPTPDAIDKAVNAGGDTPLYALTHPAPGAYPLVWVNHFYAPAKGLTIAKTEALATTIRYLATAGQDAALAVGDGRLSTALVAQALAGADKLVTGNCVGSDRRIVKSSDPGPDAPNLPAMKTIGPMLHCEAALPVAPTTTTTAAPTTTPSTVPLDTTPLSQYFDPSLTTPVTESSGSPSSGATPTTTPGPTTPARTTATTQPTSYEPATVILPMAIPTAVESGYDRLAALLMGSAAYLLLGPISRRLFVRIRG